MFSFHCLVCDTWMNEVVGVVHRRADKRPLGVRLTQNIVRLLCGGEVTARLNTVE